MNIIEKALHDRNKFNSNPRVGCAFHLIDGQVSLTICDIRPDGVKDRPAIRYNYYYDGNKIKKVTVPLI